LGGETEGLALGLPVEGEVLFSVGQFRRVIGLHHFFRNCDQPLVKFAIDTPDVLPR
jgi:hypothetical protein